MPASLSDAIFWVSVACCAAAQLLILRSVFAARGNARAPESLPPLRRFAEAVWAIIPALALALALAMTWRAMHPAPIDTRPLPAFSSGRGAPLT